MLLSIVSSLIILLVANLCSAARPDTLWSRVYTEYDFSSVSDLFLTGDGGIIIAVGVNGGDIVGSDMALVKLDSAGYLEWTRIYRLPGDQSINALCKTINGGYLLATTNPVSDTTNRGFHVVRTDARGDVLWTRSLMRDTNSVALDVWAADDGSFFGAGAQARKHQTDSFIAKLDSSGNIQWRNRSGGKFDDRVVAIWGTSDGGCISVGTTESFGAGHPRKPPSDSLPDYIQEQLMNLPGFTDIFLVKIDDSGKKEWSRTFGGMKSDYPVGVWPTFDGGYMIVGMRAGEPWVFKTDPIGEIVWQRAYGYLRTTAAAPTHDGGAILVGSCRMRGSGWSTRACVMKTDGFGRRQWRYNLNPQGWATAFAVKQAPDRWYVVAGLSGESRRGRHGLLVFKLAHD